MEQKTQITDKELIEQIISSNLREDQKKDLSTLASQMTAEERVHLLQLIAESNKIESDFENKKKEELSALNKDYSEKLKQSSRKESTYIRNEFEKFDKEESVKEFENIESEIVTSANTQIAINKQNNQLKQVKINKNLTLKLVIALILLLSLAGVILFGISYLNTI